MKSDLLIFSGLLLQLAAALVAGTFFLVSGAGLLGLLAFVYALGVALTMASYFSE